MNLHLRRVLIVFILFISTFYCTHAQTVVNSLAALRTAMVNSNQNLVLTAGNYYLEDLASDSRVFNCSGSNNTIDLTGVRIISLVGSIREVYFIISGDDNVVRNGAIEDYYKSGLQEVSDYSAYNNDKNNLAYGLKGAPVMSVTGNRNLVVGLEMTVKGSFPYGYGSQYGIGAVNTFGLNKRCGILITGKDGGGVGNTLDSITMHHHAFGHGIFMQEGATETTIKNSTVEGRMRLSDDMYNDTETYDLPYLSGYKFPAGDSTWKLPFVESYDIPLGVMYPLSEDGIRSYNNTGSVIVENCTIKQMRGGIRLYLASSATVTNTKAIDCGATNFNMPANGVIKGSSGNFSYAPLSDFRLNRSRQNIEMTILPSPNAIGPHNLADVLGDNHEIVFHRTAGPLDTTTRAIVVYGKNSIITNETEYAMILDASSSGNTIISCGPVTDLGTNNKVTINSCFEAGTCANTTALIQAECYDNMFGITTEASDDGTDNIGNVHNGDWAVYNNIDLTGMYSIKARVATVKDGVFIEVRLDGIGGELLATIPVTKTGAWQTWTTEQANIGVVDGVHDLFFVFKGGSGGILNANWFGFSQEIYCANTATHIEAECYDNMLGIQTEDCSEGTLNMGWINHNDWAMYSNIDLTNMNSIKARVSSKLTGSIFEVHLDAIDGTMIAQLPVSNTGGNQTWVTDSANILATAGVHDIYLVFKGATGYLFNLNHFGFSEEVNVVTGYKPSNDVAVVDIYPNPLHDIITIQTYSDSESNIVIVNAMGQIVSEYKIVSQTSIDLSHLSNGLYLMKIINGNNEITKIIIKQ